MPNSPDERPTDEVGSEGGGTGDVEVRQRTPPSRGSEATETSRPEPAQVEEIRHDETGQGRRSPTVDRR
jgi:hypothetical protein